MVAKRLGIYLEAKGISYYAFENKLGVSRGSISKAVKDNKSIGSAVLENILIEYADLSPIWLMTGSGDMLKLNSSIQLATPNIENTFTLRTDRSIDEQRIPLYELDATAGMVSLFSGTSSLIPMDYITIPNIPKCDGAMHVVGDSMYPILKSGDIVLYKEVMDVVNEIFWGEMYLISFNVGGEEYVTVKYIQQSEIEGCIKLVSHNKHHQAKDIPISKVLAIAIIKASIRYNSMK